MFKNKKIYLIILILILSLSTVINAEHILIRYMRWANPVEIESTKELIKIFEEENPNVKIKAEFAAWGEYWKKLMILNASGVAPDVYLMGGVFFQKYAQLGVLLPLNDYFRKSKINFRDYYPSPFKVFTYKNELYGFPRDINTIALYYNKTLFDKYNVRYPDESWTWTDLFNAAKKLTRDNDGDGNPDHWGILLRNEWEQCLSNLIWQNDGNIIDPKTGMFDLTNPNTVEAFQFIYDMMYKYKLSPTKSEMATYGNLFFPAGKVAMTFDGSWLAQYFDENIKRFEWDIAPVPHQKKRVVAANGVAHVIYRNTKYPDIAWKFIKFLSGETAQIALAKSKTSIPILKKAAWSKHFLDKSTKPESKEVYLQELEYSRPLDFIPDYFEIYEDVIKKPFQKMFNPLIKLEPKEACRIANEKGNKALLKMRKNYQSQPPLSGNQLSWIEQIFIYGSLILVFLYFLIVLKSYLNKSTEFWGYLLVSPYVIGITIFMVGPILMSFIISFSKWNIFTIPKLIGLHNYIELIKDPLFWKACRNTFYFTIISVPTGLFLSLIIAILLNQKVKGQKWYRTAYFLPVITSMVAVSLVWNYIFNTRIGLLNIFLNYTGIDSIAWLENENIAMLAIVIMSVWKGLGYNMVIFLAALQEIPESYYEAARIDGASAFQQFLNITLPSISPITFFVMLLALISSFQAFEQMYVMTKGGPNDATITLVYLLYRNAFNYFKMGYASSIAYALFLIIFIATMIQIYFQKKWVHYS